MTSKGTFPLILAMALAAPAQAAGPIDLQPLLVTNLSGTLRVQQDLPSVCSDIDLTTPVTAGRIEMTPWRGRGVPGGRVYDLIRASAVIAPFTLHASCDGPDQSREYDEVGVQLAIAAPFTAAPLGGDVYQVTIPKHLVRVYEAAIADGGLETGYKHPQEDVTATINYPAGTVQMRVVLGTKIHIDECIPFVLCVDDDFYGTLTAEVTGTIQFPDSDGDGVPDPEDNCRLVANRDQSRVATPVIDVPYDLTVASCREQQVGRAIGIDLCDMISVDITGGPPAVLQPGLNQVTWTAEDAAGRRTTAVQRVTVVDREAPTAACLPADPDEGGEAGGYYRVSAQDSCGGPALSLGPYALADGEVVLLTRSRARGVVLLGVLPGTRTRHFRVGPNEDVVRALDRAGNVGTAHCWSAVPLGEGWERVIVNNSCPKGLVEDVNELRVIKAAMERTRHAYPNLADVVRKQAFRDAAR